ncbi:hypothetical protein D3C80_1577600 [compost metagenome]
MFIYIIQEIEILQQFEAIRLPLILKKLIQMQCDFEICQSINFLVLHLKGMHRMARLLFRLVGSMNILDGAFEYSSMHTAQSLYLGYRYALLLHQHLLQL